MNSLRWLTLSWLVALCCLSTTAMAQEFDFRHYTVDDGLPSSEVYQVIQDSSGFLWFATDQGVSRFDGYEFETYTTSDGLPDNVVFGFGIDTNHRIWTYSLSQHLAYFEDGRFHEAPDSPLLQQLDERIGPINQIIPVSPNEVYVGYNVGAPLLLKEGQLISLVTDSSSHAHFDLLDVPGGSLISLYRDFRLYGDQLLKHPGLFINHEAVPIEMLDFARSTHIYHLQPDPGRWIFTFMEGVYEVGPDSSVQAKILPGRSTNAMFADDAGTVWVGTVKGVAAYYSDGTERVFFPNEAITSICQDREGGYWFTTQFNGVWYLPEWTFTRIRSGSQSDNIKHLLTTEKGVYFATKSGDLLWAKTAKILQTSPTVLKTGHLSAGMNALSDGEVSIRFFAPGIFVNYQEGAPLDSLEVFFLKLPRKEGGYWLSEGRQLYLSSSDGRVGSKSRNPAVAGEKRFFFYTTDRDGTLWMYGFEGLLRYAKGDSIEILGNWIPEMAGPIKSVVEYPLKNSMLVAGRKFGLVAIVGDSMIALGNGRFGDKYSINDLAIDEKGVIWAGTNNGLFRLTPDPNSDDEWAFRVRRIGRENGLFSHEINELELFGDTLFLGTTRGLTIFDTRNYHPNQLPPALRLVSVTVNGAPILSQSGQSFPHDSNFFEIQYRGLNYRNAGNLTYRHRLTGVDDDWNTTQNTEVRYPKLAPGLYSFQFNVMNEDGVWNPEPLTFSFEIRPPFWATWWFRITVGLLVVGLIVLVFRLRARAAQRRFDMQEAIRESEQKALRAQISPHFIFNSLNSIQKFILNSDQRSAQNYLSVFSKIIRQSLNHSAKDFVPLSGEIELLENYVQLESLRLDHQIDFRVTVDPAVNAYTIEIPPMLIQPFVENAIWHGLMQKEGPGMIEVSFIREREGRLRCEVRDNGVGRPREKTKAEAFLDAGGRPSGLSISRQRVRLLWEKYRLQETIHIEDLVDESNQPAGTAVTFYVPYEF